MTTLREVTNTGSPMVGPDGTPVEGATITFQLVDTFGAPITAWDITTGQPLSGIAQVLTDSNGIFSIELWPNDQGVEASRYLCICIPQAIKFVGLVSSGSGALTFEGFYFGTVSQVNYLWSAGEVPAGLINGVNKIYTLTNIPINTIPLLLNGLGAIPGIDYTLSGNTITLLGSALEPGESIYTNSYQY